MWLRFLQLLNRFWSSDSGHFRLCLKEDDTGGGGGGGGGGDDDDGDKGDKKFAKKYKSVEELEAGYTESEKKLAEASTATGTLQKEMDELKRVMDGYRKKDADANKRKSAAVLDADADPAVAKAQKALNDFKANNDPDKLSGIELADWTTDLQDLNSDLREAKSSARKAADKETHKKVSSESIDRFINDDRKFLQKKHSLSDDEMKELSKFGVEHGCQTYSEAYNLKHGNESAAELKKLKDAAEKKKNEKDKDQRKHPARRSTDDKGKKGEESDARPNRRKSRMTVVNSAAKDPELAKSYKILMEATGQGIDN